MIIDVELITPDKVSHSYIRMSHIPRVGDNVFWMAGDDEDTQTDCVVSKVKWLIDTRSNENESDGVVVTLKYDRAAVDAAIADGGDKTP